jgi:hypothetical protein
MSHLTISNYKKPSQNQDAMTSQKLAKERDNKNTNKPTEHKKSTNSNNNNVCFLCGREGHYGSPTSCYASTHVKKVYFN